eukprot:scaffold3978_cov61-Phaeocystis_antarctica.AAC.2
MPRYASQRPRPGAAVAAVAAAAAGRRTRSKLAVVERRGPPRSNAATWAEWLCLSAASPQNGAWACAPRIVPAVLALRRHRAPSPPPPRLPGSLAIKWRCSTSRSIREGPRVTATRRCTPEVRCAHVLACRRRWLQLMWCCVKRGAPSDPIRPSQGCTISPSGGVEAAAEAAAVISRGGDVAAENSAWFRPCIQCLLGLPCRGTRR